MSDLDELDDDSNEDVETATAAEVLQKLEEVTNKLNLEFTEFPLINAQGCPNFFRLEHDLKNKIIAGAPGSEAEGFTEARSA